MKIGIPLFILLVLFGLTACQKELDFPVTPSTGSLKADASHDCFPSFVNGQYLVDTTLNSNNYIEVQVGVTNTGAYTIQSDTINGYSFFAEGDFDSLGINTIKLFGTGTPLNIGLNHFTIRYDTSSCLVDILILPPSDFNLVDCGGIVVSGQYMQGELPDNSNIVSINVNVVQTGNYFISTYQNGITFSASGTFATTGVQSIILMASGSPTAAGTFNFILNDNNGNSCSFPVTCLPFAATQASYSVGGASGGCSNSIISGNFIAGVPMDASNSITIEVVVESLGSYTMSTGVVNGVLFNASGVFLNFGLQTLTLPASGTPIVPGAFDIGFYAPLGACGVVLNVGPDFISSSYNGDSVITYNNNLSAVLSTTAGVEDLVISGKAIPGGMEAFSLELKVPGNIAANTNYTVNQFADGIFVTLSNVDPANTVWSVTTDAISVPLQQISIIRIQSITTGVGGRVKGTFAGYLKENGTGPAIKQIAYGGFDLPLQ